jgi:cytochrome P450
VEFDFGRVNAGEHSTFGNGVHRCAGAMLARMEMRITIEEWFARIPQFRIDERRPFVVKGGLVGLIESLPLRWDPVPPAGHHRVSNS